jgi:hypothetical protein
VLGLGLLALANWAYHVLRKPAELLAPLTPAFAKSPADTWAAYGPLFREHATDLIAAEFLAALAQVEGSGNPIARTYWRWRWSLNPLAWYGPASSAVGMFQMTDGTFEQARQYCIHDHRVVRDGPWYDLRSCWLNRFYNRVVPSHAIEMTAASLHQSVVDTLGRTRVARATLGQQQDLAAVIHLCGPRRGEAFVRRGFRALPGERCGDHGLPEYLHRIHRLQRRFERVSALGFEPGVPDRPGAPP